jgi:hypothetical protein
MKRSNRDVADAVAKSEPLSHERLSAILASLQTMRDGDFSVGCRDPGPDWKARSPTL